MFRRGEDSLRLSLAVVDLMLRILPDEVFRVKEKECLNKQLKHSV
jgi:hypothetical protein